MHLNDVNTHTIVIAGLAVFVRKYVEECMPILTEQSLHYIGILHPGHHVFLFHRYIMC